MSANSDAGVPGTYILESSNSLYKHTSSGRLVLQPQPSNDPNDPLNWSKRRKYINFSLTLVYVVFGFANLQMVLPIWETLIEELGFTNTELNNSTGANLAGLALGCLLFIPLAVRFGRRPIYLFTSLVLIATCFWQGSMKKPWELYVINVLSGLASSTSETILQMTIADMFFVHQRGTMNGWNLIAMNLGNFGGPAIGGYIASGQNWHWPYYYLGIFMCIMFFTMFFFFEETKYLPVLTGVPSMKGTGSLEAECSTNDKKTAPASDLAAISDRDVMPPPPLKSYRERLPWYTYSTPKKPMILDILDSFKILYLFPIVAYVALQYGAVLVWLVLQATCNSMFLGAPPYNWGPAALGNANWAGLIGSTLGSIYGGPINDWFIIKVSERRGGVHEAETRLYPIVLNVIALPLGLLLYGLSLAANKSWVSLMVGYAIVSFAVGSIPDITIAYLMDCHTGIISKAFPAVVFVRNSFSTILSFTLVDWIDLDGIRNVYIICAAVSIAVTLLFLPFAIFGKRIRIACASRYHKYARDINDRFD